jgi:hypothetical protein
MRRREFITRNEPNLLDSTTRAPGARPVEFIEVNGTGEGIRFSQATTHDGIGFTLVGPGARTAMQCEGRLIKFADNQIGNEQRKASRRLEF